MIISRTPFRISFFGGGTDYPSWYRAHGGSVLGTTIDKYCYLTCRYLPPFFEHRIRVVYSAIENCQSLDDIAHPAVREALRFMKVDRGVEIHHDGDLPARSGMGSSSSFSVGLLHALHALKGSMPSKRQLAQEAIHIEREVLEETVGSQDQVLVAHGGFNHITFLANGDFSVRPITIPHDRVDELQAHLMLFFSGVQRTASEVARSYVEDLDASRRQLRIMKDLVEEGIGVLSGRHDLGEFGMLLHEAWQAKRQLGAAVTSPAVDALYERARAAGATGGKLVGAGGGGFLLLFAAPELRRRVREALSDLLYVPFRFESSGSQIVVFDPEDDYAADDLVWPAERGAGAEAVR